MSDSFFAYCDESGQRSYGPKTDSHFVIASVIAEASAAPHLEDEVRGLKRAFWGSPEIEIKSNWIRIPSERQLRYTTPHGITSKDIDALVDATYRWMHKAPLRLLAGVIDKPAMQKKYVAPHYPGSVAYNMFLQRFQKYVSKHNASGAVVFDDPAGKSPGGYEWRTLLQRHHNRLLKKGCEYTATTFESIGPITFTDSKASPLVQLADLTAYNVFRQFRDHGTAWEDNSISTLPTYPFFLEILDLFDHGPGKVFAGYGVAKWPLGVKIRWCVT